MDGPVETAVRSHIVPGQIPYTPDLHKAAPFTIDSMDANRLILVFGEKQTKTKIPWRSLEGTPGFLGNKGWVEIGGRFDVGAKSSTLSSYLKLWINRETAG